MYTDAYARIEINNSLWKPFKVTRAAAQGCVLNPIFFNIYLDDLLKRFRESNLGVPVGCTSVNKYLEILNSWCEENFFSINTDKSGILRVPFLLN